MIPTASSCGSCGLTLTDEYSIGDPEHREPCPRCGSLTRTVAMEGRAELGFTATAELSVTTYPETLLKAADDLLQRNQYGICVVVAHMACEVATERALSEAFRAKGIEDLEEPILNYLNGFNLATDRNRQLYSALTGDLIQTQPFWAAFKESATRRNAVVHKSKMLGCEEAVASLTATKSFVAHLKK